MASADQISEQLRQVMAGQTDRAQISDQLRQVMSQPADPFARQRLVDQAIGKSVLAPSPMATFTPPPQREAMGPPPAGSPPILTEEPPQAKVTPVLDIYRRQPGTQVYAGPPSAPPLGAMGPPSAGRTVDLTPGPESSDVKEFLNTPVLPVKAIGKELDKFMVGPFDWLHRSAIDAAMGMTTPLNAAITAGTMGLSGVAEAGSAATRAAAKAIQSGTSSYFATQAGRSALAQAPAIADAYKRGDYAAMFKAGGQALVDGVFAAAAATHAAGAGIGSVEDLAKAVPKTTPPPGDLSSEAGVLKLPDLTGAVERFNDRWIDAALPISRMEKAGGVTGDASSYRALRNFAGNPGRLELKQREARGILLPVEQQGLMPDLNRYLELQRHEENFLDPAKYGNYKTPGNMTLPQVQNELTNMTARLGPDKATLLENAAQQIRNWSDRALADYHASGMVPTDAFNEMTRPGHKYAPLQRADFFPEDTEHIPTGGRSFNTRNQPVVKSLVGSEREIVPPVEGFLRNVINMTSVADKNRVTARIGDMGQDPNFSGVIRQLTGAMKPGPNEGAISTFRDGVKETYAVPAPVAKAVGEMSVSDADLMMRWAKNIQRLNRVMITASTTYNPAFQVGNIIRDYKTATLQSAAAGHLFTPVTWLKGFASSVGQDKYFDKYLDSGGAFSGFFERQGGTKPMLDRIVEPQWKRYGRDVLPWNLANTISQKIEQAPRVGFFRMLDEANANSPTPRSLGEMGFMSRNATTDFARSGSDMRVLNMWLPMLNARKEGLVNSLSAFKKSPGKALLVLNAWAIPTVVSYLHNVTEHPDVYKDISQRYKNNYDFVISGNEKDDNNNYTQVHGVKKDDIWAAYSNLLVDFMDRMRQDNPQNFSRMATQILSDTLPVRFANEGRPSLDAVLSNAPPTIKALALEPGFNRNLSTSSPIETEEMKNATPSNRYTNDTPEWLRSASKAIPDFLNLSPRQLQNMAITQFGAVGRMAAGDVRPGRDAVMERTGMGPVQRMFSGAPGGGLEQNDFTAAEPITRAGADIRLERDRTAKALWASVKDLPPEKRVGILQDSFRADKLDFPTFEKFMGDAKDGLEKITGFERWLRAQPEEDRGPILVQKLDLTPRSQAVELMKRYAGIGVFNDSTAEAMMKVYAKRGYGFTAAPASKPGPSVKDALKEAMQGGK